MKQACTFGTEAEILGAGRLLAIAPQATRHSSLGHVFETSGLRHVPAESALGVRTRARSVASYTE